MDPKQSFFFPKRDPGFWTFEISSWILSSNQLFWSIYRDINFVLKCFPAHCEQNLINILATFLIQNVVMPAFFHPTSLFSSRFRTSVMTTTTTTVMLMMMENIIWGKGRLRTGVVRMGGSDCHASAWRGGRGPPGWSPCWVGSPWMVTLPVISIPPFACHVVQNILHNMTSNISMLPRIIGTFICFVFTHR